MSLYFIRHNFSVSDDRKEALAVLNEIWDRRMAVIDYKHVPGDDAFNEKKYDDDKTAQNTLIRFKKMMREGANIAIVCNAIKPGKMLIGRVDPTEVFKPTVFKSKPGYDYKAAQLMPAAEVTIAEYPGLFSKIPRQTAFCEWSSAETLFRSAFNREPMPSSVKSLVTGQLEALCYEFMKEKNLIAHLLMPVGRSLPSVDVVGLDANNRPTIAQVTFAAHEEGPGSKSAALADSKASSSAEQALFFCDSPSMDQDIHGNRVINIEDVFNYMLERRPNLVRHMLGYK